MVAAFGGSADYAAVSASTIFTLAQAAAKLVVTDVGGTYNGQPLPATSTVAGVDTTPAASLEGVSPTFTYFLSNANGSMTLLSGAPSTAGHYEVVAFFAGSADYAAVSRAATFTIKKSAPSFSLLFATTILEGTATTVVTGTISLGGLIPTSQVTIPINGVSATAVIQADGSFSATIATGLLGAGKHTITYSYGGDDNFESICAKETLTVTS